MQYHFTEFTIQQLFELVDNNKVDLNPSYQRNFIWSPLNQKELIDTVLKGYPLPAIFLYSNDDKHYEMVDGQQRTKTIYRFIKGVTTSSKIFGNANFNQIDKVKFLSYRLPVILISNLDAGDSLKEFYVLINKKGVHVNVAETNKSEFHDTNFLKLANDLLTYQNLIELDLFSEAASKRMNDRAFIEELLGYLISGKSKDKKQSVSEIYSKDITDEEYLVYEEKFKYIIDKIQKLNSIYPISKTRFKQKNDFYTLFSFVEGSQDEQKTLDYQYKILLVLDRDDSDGRQFIRPSNEDSSALKDYATNCITQSNSKSARDKRLQFFNSILKNTDISRNEQLTDVLNYLSTVYSPEIINLVKIDKYELLDVNTL